MSSKVVVVLLFGCLAARALAIELGAVDTNDDHVSYEFQYAVHDPHTGDIKSQKESRQADKVEGVYELIDSDGHRRVVQYKADDHSGFEAIVQRLPTDIKIPLPEPEKKLIHTKILTHAQPLIHLTHKQQPILQHAELPEPAYGNYASVS